MVATFPAGRLEELLRQTAGLAFHDDSKVAVDDKDEILQ